MRPFFLCLAFCTWEFENDSEVILAVCIAIGAAPQVQSRRARMSGVIAAMLVTPVSAMATRISASMS